MHGMHDVHILYAYTRTHVHYYAATMLLLHIIIKPICIVRVPTYFIIYTYVRTYCTGRQRVSHRIAYRIIASCVIMCNVYCRIVIMIDAIYIA